MPVQRTICHFSGDVQGVGFRYTVKRIASRFDVRGYVRNLSDGRVELLVEGANSEIDRLIEEVTQSMRDHVRHVDRQVHAATGEFDSFSIR